MRGSSVSCAAALPAVAIVPAAGRSERMGRPKLLLLYGGGTVLGATVAALRDGGAASIVVVAAADDAPLRAWCAAATESLDETEITGAAAVTGEATPAAHGTAGALILATNPAPERGMLSSVLEGLAALGGAAGLARRGAPLLVCPGDLPALRATTVAELLCRRHAAGAGLAVPVWQGRRGHPLVIAPALVPEIATLDPGRGLRQLLDLHPGELLRVEVDDPGCIADLDTPADYERLRSGAEGAPAGRSLPDSAPPETINN